MERDTDLMEMTADIVSAYVGNNRVGMDEIRRLISEVHATLRDARAGSPDRPAGSATAPAVSVKKSVTPNYIICLENGRRFKSLKRHLRSQYGMSPDDYRQKWGLPGDYPMVAPNYAAARSRLAKQIGLGQPTPGGRRKKTVRKVRKTAKKKVIVKRRKTA